MRAASAAEPPVWRDFSPPGGGFSIRLPGQPAEQPVTEQGMHSFELQAGDEDYVVSYADLLPEMKSLVPAQILEKLRDDFVQRTSGARLVGSKPFRLDGKPGLSWVIEANARGGPTYRIKMAAVVAGDRLYQYGFVGPRDTFDEVAVDRYLETFELAPR